MRPFASLFLSLLFFLLFHIIIINSSPVVGGVSSSSSHHHHHVHHHHHHVHHHRGVHLADHANLVPKLCRSAAAEDPNINYTFCVETLGSSRRSRTADVKGLGVIAVKLARANATATRKYVKKLLKSKAADEGLYLKSCLGDCLELYSDAVSTLRDTAKAIREGRYDDANQWLSAVSDDPDTCHQGFVDGGLRDPLRKRNRDLFRIAIIALSITNSLAK